MSSTGTPVSFFTNPYVIDWLRGLNPAHRPIYRLKFLRILRVIQFILNKEISLILMELYLLYGESFVASTSDFWWDRVRNQSFGACILNFMAKRYTLLNGMSLFMSDTTLASFSSEDNPRGWIAKCQMMILFSNRTWTAYTLELRLRR